MTDVQKIAVLTGITELSNKDSKVLGIPKLSVGKIKDYTCDAYPEPGALVNAWDKELWQRVAAEEASAMQADGVSLAVVKGSKIKLSPHSREISEDICLAEAMTAYTLKAFSDNGMPTALSGCYLSRSDLAWLDKNPNERIINDYFVSPYTAALSCGGVDAIITDRKNIGKEYLTAEALAKEKIFGKVRVKICERATEENTVEFISRKIICLEASKSTLEAAINRYNALLKLLKSGSMSQDQLDEEVASGSAISLETVDEAVDNTLDFLFALDERQKRASAESDLNCDLAEKALIGSSVLLKNRGDVLPLNKEECGDVGIIYAVTSEEESELGFANALSEQLSESGYNCTKTFERAVGTEADDMSDIKTAMRLCNSVDTVILILGFNKTEERQVSKNEKLSLPANQLYLAHKIALSGKKVIAILSARHAPDIEFTRAFEAVMLTTVDTKGSAKAVCEMLSGKCSPSGKLAYTLYAGSDAAFAKKDVYREKYGMKSGPFIGYRYYDTAGMHLGYPFGHGLSYAYFAYSNISLADGEVSFTVENKSETLASEIVQVYIGKNGSSILRPKKELCAFEKIELEPMQRQRVTLKITVPTVNVNGEDVTEDGEYTVFVGASVDDIRLTQKISVSGKSLAGDGERISDYLQTVSNVVEENYTLEANYSKMKRSYKNIIFGVSAMALAISLALFNAFTGTASVFLGVIAGIVALGSIIFFILQASEQSRAYEEYKADVALANEKYFDEAEQISVPSVDKMFHDEFDSADLSEAVVEEVSYEVDDDHSEYIDASFRMNDAVKAFERLALERGCKLGEGVARDLLVSFATSRLIITEGVNADDFSGVMHLLAEYFETNAYIDDETETEIGQASLFETDSTGHHNKKNILRSLDRAVGSVSEACFAALNCVKGENVSDYLTPFIKYISAPKARNSIVVYNENGTNIGQSIPPNLRIIINLSKDNGICRVPQSVLRLAAVTNISLVRCNPADYVTVTKGVNRYQLDYMAEKECRADISEEFMKKIDKLEREVASVSDYKIGNKLWLWFEKHISMLTLCEADADSAADAAMLARLVPSMAKVYSEGAADDAKPLGEIIEFIFGEDKLPACKELVASFIYGKQNDEGVAVKAESASVSNDGVRNTAYTTESVSVKADNNELYSTPFGEEGKRAVDGEYKAPYEIEESRSGAYYGMDNQ